MSWIAFKDIELSAALDSLRLGQGSSVRRTHKVPRPAGWKKLRAGWTVILSNNLDLFKATDLASLSTAGAVVHGLMEDHVMFSGVRLYERGAEMWSVTRDAEEDHGLDLTVTGDPPDSLAILRTKALAYQRKHDDVDALFDVPLALSKKVCGFRADHGDHEWIKLTFVRSTKSGFLARMFRSFGR